MAHFRLREQSTHGVGPSTAAVVGSSSAASPAPVSSSTLADPGRRADAGSEREHPVREESQEREEEHESREEGLELGHSITT